MDATLTINGNVGSAVDFGRTPQTGVARATFRLACTPRIYRNGNWVDDYTTWITVTCWRQLAEHVASSLNKGDPVIVTGRLRTQVWDDDGGHHQRMVLEATQVGHDLTRGVSTFSRAPRAESDSESAPDDDAAIEQPDGSDAELAGVERLEEVAV
ncbi:single-stranded DNA-binding protein [Microlunatus elymi]|uniref:Single-stranded DNA-binding protein n=1 Tax=Microlunatus elymi TaxID=2596828 RepID=A0A516PXD7_9ACTN|nr:single-stranded DNA-binding protein [Microlunatus elymi]QDP95844.1 single-stranded DNA-binding protein [Microlunatus elymi]